ncbi:trehalase family glycosidase [Winogradskyella sp.]|uniref:MGH1-like glycoside hydrolase domain-containing protein n=1 Tax=Winogradskyella sp. TaxID=1883156 RepID=UPI0025F514E3|nr:trehalase family glycosidase [Winogradskyella sp.]
MKRIFQYLIGVIILTCIGCKQQANGETITSLAYLKNSENTLDFGITPRHKYDRDGLMYSDQGAWFAFGIQDSTQDVIGFSGPFLMTQQNGTWSSKNLTGLKITNQKLELNTTRSFNSHLEQSFQNKEISVTQYLTYISGHTALVKSEFTNTSNTNLELQINWESQSILADSLSMTSSKNELIITSKLSTAIGHILFPKNIVIPSIGSTYFTNQYLINLKPNETKSVVVSQSFIFPEYSWEDELELIKKTNFDSILKIRKTEKSNQLNALIKKRKTRFKDSIYAQVLTKAHLTLQNNWRIPAGEIKHEGLFPSYHYVWFNGFWSWDSWKHSVGLSHFDTRLAKEQIKLMFDFQLDDGFIVDCVYRDTLIEAHNWRDTKPPLSAWAVAKIYEKDKDIEFIKYMYPKLKKYHNWWYNKRDHDQDGICEYGSTDGSAIASKWESGMDNAIRFDNIEMLKNSEGAYSMNQESVDLNAYLYAEKLFLADLADALELDDSNTYRKDADALKIKVQTQFFDTEDGWFYDTNIEGNTFIKGEGSEGWTALWANAATQEQAEAVKNRMMNPKKFYTHVPFQTMSADHPKFDPLKGYWRGPNWFDQSYFGTKGLRNYGFKEEADKATIQILKGAEGLLDKGMSIRENYHPLTGKGGNAKNFSWSAAHIIMMLLDE